MNTSRLSPRRRSLRRLRFIWLLLLGATLLALAGLGIKGWRIATQARALQATLAALPPQAEQAISTGQLSELGPALGQARQQAAALRDEAAPLFPITRRLGWVPGYGPDLAAADRLLDAAATLTAAAEGSYSALVPSQGAAPTLDTLAAQLLAAQPQLQSARAQLGQASAQLETIDAGALSPALGQPLRQLQARLPQARDALDLALAAPWLLGADAPRDYLLLAQNPDELRATGGFISGAGVLTLQGGRVSSFTIDDSALVDNLSNGDYPLAPEPIRRYMGLSYQEPLLWMFRDANWSPDFPSSARAALELYQLGQRRQVSNVIAFDPSAVQLLLEALGPLSVAGIDTPVSSANVQQYMRDAWSAARQQGHAAQRKAFLAQLGSAIIARAEQGGALDLPALARAVQRALDQRDLMITVADPSAATVLARQGWDGAVNPGAGDFLMVVDSNLGYDKVNPNIRQSITYAVDLSAPSAPQAAITIQHTHQQPSSADCGQWVKRGGAATQRYEDRMDDCYWNYLRVLAPGASELIDFSAASTPDSWMLSGVGEKGTIYAAPSEAGTTTFGTFLVVPRGGTRSTTIRYRLPQAAVAQSGGRWHYHLALQNQAGQRQQITLEVQLPEGAGDIAASIEPSRSAGRVLTFEIDLRSARTLDLLFSSP